jgi:hypothetical protein
VGAVELREGLMGVTVKTVTVKKAEDIPTFVGIPQVHIMFRDGVARDVVITDGVVALAIGSDSQYSGITISKPAPPKKVKKFVVRGTLLGGAATVNKAFDTKEEAEDQIRVIGDSAYTTDALSVAEEDVEEQE